MSSYSRGRGGRGGRRGGASASESHDVQLSRKLSSILRHKAIQFRLPIRSDGYMRTSALLAHLNHVPRASPYTLADLRAVTDGNDKQRFNLVQEGGEWWMRANQGHSFPVPDLELTPILLDHVADYPCVVHGTYFKSWPAIRGSGLSRMARTHVHLAKGVAGERHVISGMRSSAEVYVYVDLARALADGYLFFVSLNGVILTPGNEEGILPAKYFSKVTDSNGKELPLD